MHHIRFRLVHQRSVAVRDSQVMCAGTPIEGLSLQVSSRHRVDRVGSLEQERRRCFATR